ncbi:MAG: efflux RND transporter permease subunit [Candidatus Fermentibacteraceae bacterium]
MSLPGIAARRRVTFLMVFLVMAGAGIFGLTRLGLDYFPKVDLGEIVVVTALPGAGPEDVENLVTRELEDAVTGVESVETVESESSAGLSAVFVEVSLGADIDRVEEDIREAVERMRSTLPDNATDPLIFALESSQKPLMILGFSSPAMTSSELRRLVDDEISPVLGRVRGISSADIAGGEVRQINVRINPVLLWDRGITLTQVYGALSAVSADRPGGDIEADRLEVPLSVKSGFHSLDDIRELVIGSHGGVPVRLRDVAEVEDGFREATSISRLDGESNVLLIFRKSSDANTVNTCRRLEGEIERLSGNYEGLLSMEIIYSQEDFVISSMTSLLQTGIQAVLLAAAVLILFLGSAANSGIVSISMPLSFVATFAAMYLFGVNLNIMSLAGLSISIGMIVDNSVVVLENIHRLRREGAKVLEGAERGAAQVGMAVAASTMTTVSVFVPMLFVRGMTGQIFRDLSITIASALFISLFVSQTLIPLLAGMSDKLVKSHRRGSPLGKIQDWIHRLEEYYVARLGWFLTHRWLTILPVAAVLAVSVFLLRYIPTSFLPDVKEGVMQINASMPQGSNLAFTDSVAAALEDSIIGAMEPGDLLHSRAQVGRSEGIGAAFGSDASWRIDLSLYFAQEGEMEGTMDGYQDSVRAILEDVPGLDYAITTGMPIGNEYPIQVAVYGTDLQDLRETGERVRRAMSEIPGTVEHRTSLDEWVSQIDFHPDEAVLSQRGVTPAEVGFEVTLGVLGLDASTYYEEDREVDVHMQYAEEFRSSPEMIRGLPAAGAPLEAWGDFRSSLVPQKIWRRDRVRSVRVSAKIEGRALGDVGGDLTAMMDTLDLGGRRWELLGDIPEQEEAFGSMALAIAVAVGLVYMVMASQFESLLEPFMLIFEIPMALIGVILIHFFGGMTLGITSLVGILMLAGIVVNNGIVLVDFANRQRREHGMKTLEAVVEAGRKRMRPILMTASTTILALMPLAMGGSSSADIWAPMARTVIGGMLVATPLTLVVLPVLYVALDRLHSVRRRDG